MVALGHRYVVVCVEFYGAAKVIKVCSLQYFRQKSDNFQHIFCVCWCGKLRLAELQRVVVFTGVEFKVCRRHHESNLCKLFIFCEARIKPHSQ